jgi:spermidine/putrescine-binding protein
MTPKLILPRPSRRKFLKNMGVTAAAVAAPIIVPRWYRARAQGKPGTIRMMGGPTLALSDWSLFERETGLKMEFTPFHTDNVGTLFNEFTVNGASDRFDLVQVLGGVQRGLADKGYVEILDTSKLKNYSGIAEGIRQSPLLVTPDGKSQCIPIYMNADSFGYFPAKLKKPRPPEMVNWDLLLNSDETRGQCSMDGDFLALMWGGMYLKTRKLADINDPSNMTEKECKTATDWLIERKKAGQFRNFWSNYDDQVANFVSGEVLVQRCWEPAVHDAQKKGLDVVYATCSDFHIKWVQVTFVPTPSKNRSNWEDIYKALDWFLSGSYSAELAALRGYCSSRPDLGLEYAKAQNWDAQKTALLTANLEKIKVKFANPNFWITGLPDRLEFHESEMERFKNA